MMNRSHICLLSRKLPKMNNSCKNLNVQHRYQFCVCTIQTVCSFNEKANSRKLLAWLTSFSAKHKKLSTRESIIQFDSVWWFMDESCTIRFVSVPKFDARWKVGRTTTRTYSYANNQRLKFHLELFTTIANKASIWRLFGVHSAADYLRKKASAVRFSIIVSWSVLWFKKYF